MSVTRALAERTAVSYDDLRRGLERVVDFDRVGASSRSGWYKRTQHLVVKTAGRRMRSRSTYIRAARADGPQTAHSTGQRHWDKIANRPALTCGYYGV